MEQERRRMRAFELRIEREQQAEIEANRHFNLPKEPEVLRRAEEAAKKYLTSLQETSAKAPCDARIPTPDLAKARCRFQQGMDDYCFTHKQVH
ncbi:hypothetical protein [Streptomyces sp. NPDC127038]|uniref:hypothetical protein n=1 Tax=Streptomyces sp. NPDC127038 TaxID=3347114 RepID=UPI003664FF37